ncbi:MAG: ABC transporter permease [Acidimicrobiia bacterium]|nr:ABC transporter permease [Acidimicrobiia bacterium]MCY4433930.1 ABC transporter permease [bacterium]
MNDFFTVSIIIATLASGIRLAVPFLLAALGEAVGQRAGVLNLGVEGVMLIGAFAAYYTALESGSAAFGLLVGLAVGAIMGLIYAFITVVMHAEQGISGIGIYLFGLGFTDLLFQKLVGTPKPISGLQARPFEWLADDTGRVGELLLNHTVLTYVAFLLVPVVYFLITKTTFGLNVRAVGENPQAADTLGVNVNRIRTAAIIIGNTMAGLAGATLALEIGIFQQNLTAGRGFIAIALVYFGAWRPVGVMTGSLLFGIVSSTVLQLQVQDVFSGSVVPIANMAPAVLTVIVLVVVSRRIGQPAALTRPFTRDS